MRLLMKDNVGNKAWLEYYLGGLYLAANTGGNLYYQANAGDHVFDSDVYNVPWTDFSGTSVTGWLSFTNKLIYYKKVGKLVYVTFLLDGTSNANNANFTLPFAANASTHAYQVLIRAMNSGTYQISFLNINSGASVVSFHKDVTSDVSTSWATSGNKKVMGEFWYEAA